MTRETGVAFVMVTHDDRLADAADRVIHVELGRVHEHPQPIGPPATGP